MNRYPVITLSLPVGGSATGAQGDQGPSGSNGVDGKSVLSGSGAPDGGLGVDGDFYVNTAASTIYGPKAAGSWGSPTSLVGPTGADGATGSAGADGATGPEGADGADGADGSFGYTLVATLASNQATGANVTPVTLTGLVWTFEANSVYLFRWIGKVQPTAATTGCGFQLDVSAAVTEIAMTFFHQLANTGTLSGGHSVADDASVGVSSGLPGTSGYPVSGQGLLRTGANTGTAQLRFRSETTAVITAMAGMTLVVEKVA